MKTIDDILKRIQPETHKELAQILNIKSPSEAKIRESMLNIFNIYRIISSFSRDELNIFRILYSGHDGISFGDIQKMLGLEIDVIEKSVQNISSLMLCYIIKNRQMLNKKMDRVHCISEISKIFVISETADIINYLNETAESLILKNELHPEAPVKDEKSMEIILAIASRGFIISTGDLYELFQNRDNEKRINDMIEKKFLRLFIILSDMPYLYLALNDTVLVTAALNYRKKNILPGITISNNFKVATNIIKAYDVISSSGLFLTKQGKFRKIDLKKIAETMLELFMADGSPITDEERAFIAMQMLSILKCLRLDRDIGIISIKNIAEKIEDPVLIIKNVLLRINEGIKPADEFIGEIKFPPHTGIKNLFTILASVKSADYDYLSLIFVTMCLSSNFKKLETDPGALVESSELQFEQSINFLTICGLTEIINGRIALSESGKKINAIIQNKKHSREIEIKKCIYISPDFTLMIPHMDIDPSSLYTIMAFTEILKEDVVIEAAITKHSIINAKKRGMNIEKFITTLKKYARNDIPQNLEFLLNDWTKQTISVNITRPILLYTSHGSFIDEMLYSSSSKSIITRISENYAILDKGSIDNIVKFAKKFDAVITIFEDND
jgi:predicted transcriptional regulator